MGLVNVCQQFFITILIFGFINENAAQSVLCQYFNPLSADEISLAGRVTFDAYRGHRIYIITITPIEPPKAAVLAHVAANLTGPCYPRRALVVLIQTSAGGIAAEVEVNLDGTGSIISRKNLPRGTQPMMTPDEMTSIETVLRADSDVVARVAKEGLTMDRIFFDIWVPGDRCAGCRDYCGKRLGQAYLYFRNFPEDNPFAHPLNFMPLVDVVAGRVIGIAELPISPGYSRPVVETLSLPTQSHNYEPSLLPPGFLRNDTMPLTTTSDSGPSFTFPLQWMVLWQGFRFFIGFNVREGVTIHDVAFQEFGKQTWRRLMYRSAFSELCKAFDNGEYGLAFDINSLILGVDCPPQGHMIDVVINDAMGRPVTIPNGICVCEVDAGLLHRHTTDRVTVARAQNLHVLFIITSGNYDYAFTYIFKQDGTMELTAGLSGLLSTDLLTHGHVPWASLVADKVMAQYHQHIFCVRLDVEIDGENNTVSTVDVVPMGTSKANTNSFGNGFVTKETVLETSLKSVTDTSIKTNRIWAIVNPNEVSPITGRKRGYMLIPNNRQLMLSSNDSWNAKRAGFAKHSTWVTQFRDDELYAAGKYPNQRDTEDGVSLWVKRNESIQNVDIVLYHVFAFTHVPAQEDFPIMGFQTTGISLKPMNYFDQYQGLHIPPPPGLDERSKRADFPSGSRRHRQRNHQNPTS